MKNSAFIFLIILASCSPTNYVNLTVSYPPIIQTSSNIKNIGLINRTTASGNSGVFNKIEEIISAEAFNIDEEATKEIMEGFGSQITAKTKFQNAKIVQTEDKRSSISNFPTELEWNEIERIAKKENIDLLVELSFFDTDSKIDYNSRNKEIEIPVIGTKTVKEYLAKITTDYKCGWRVYLPEERKIIDQFVFESFFILEGEGINPVTAVQKILEQKNIILRNCRVIGEQFAFRLLPFKVREKREYFVKGDPKLELAKRYAQAGDWDEAGNIWSDLSDSGDEKVAGRASYNMAIINEINGDFDKALEWAKKAYVIYEIDIALDYINILENRINNRNVIKQ